MKQYGFESGIGHGALKDYVYDYYAQMKKKDSRRAHGQITAHREGFE
jgi:hypothetical protein